MAKKKPYLLLELLIALFLVACLALPLIRNPSRMLQNELSDLERMELERISEVSFARIKEKLYTNEITWEQIEKGSAHQSFEESQELIALGELRPHRFVKKNYLWIKQEKESSEKEHYVLLILKTCFRPDPKGEHKKEISFIHRVFVKLEQQKIGSAQHVRLE